MVSSTSAEQLPLVRPTHADLVGMARRWLRGRCPVVITEMNCGDAEEPDAIGWGPRGSILIECKASRGDLRADANKPNRRRALGADSGGRGCGMGNARYFLAPVGLIKGDDPLVPPGWGVLLAMSKGRVRTVRDAVHRPCDLDAERTLLLSCIRRLGIESTGGTSIKVYTYQTKCRATLAVPASEQPETEGR